MKLQYLYAIARGALMSLALLGMWLLLDLAFGFRETKENASMLFTFGWATAAAAYMDRDK